MVVLASFGGNLAVVMQRRYANRVHIFPHDSNQAHSEIQNTTNMNTLGGTE